MKKLLLPCFLFLILSFALVGFPGSANAQSSTLIHYWNFNTLAGPYTHPDIPHIQADYTVLTPADSVYLEYYLLPGTSATWAADNNTSGAQIDNGSPGDTTNLRQGADAGLFLRCRNPVDSSELHWHIPSTGFTNLVIKFATQTSSIASGDSAQDYSYSTDGGKTWDSTGMTVNGAAGHSLDLTQGGNANSIYLSFALVTITFGSVTTVNNNPNLIFRSRCIGSNDTLTSGNNRYDNFTVDGVGSSGPPPPPPAVITMTTPLAGSIFVPGQKTLISFHASSTVGQMRTVQFSPDSVNWSTVGTVTDVGDTTYTWTIPNTAATKGYVSITDSAGVTAKIGPFIIFPVPSDNLIVDYWAFNTFNASYYTPNVPNLPADFTAPGTSQGYIQYVNFAKAPKYSYIDDVAGDAVYAHLGAPAGNALRVRNPTDSMNLIFAIPTTGFQGISLSYALQSSSFTGPQVQHFAYNIGNGIWTAQGITVNGIDSVKDSLDVTQAQYQGPGNGQFGLVTIGFTSEVQAAISNNPNFEFRIIFGDSATDGTSGNNRFDNFTVTATSATAGVDEPVQVRSQLVLTPNPVMDYVSFQNPFITPVNVSVLNVLGQEVRTLNAISSTDVQINTSDLSAGCYYIHVRDVNSGTEQVAKFIKQ